IGAERFHRTVDAGASTVPDLALLVARADEEREGLFTLRGKDRDRLGLLESSKEEDVAVGAVRVLDVAVSDRDRHRREDRDRAGGRHLAHAAEDFLSADLVDRSEEHTSE